MSLQFISRGKLVRIFSAPDTNATERYGAKAVGEYLADEFDLDVVFIDIDNPV